MDIRSDSHKLQEGKIYTLIRTVNQSGREVKACLMVKLMEEEKEVLADNGDGTKSRIPAEEFEKMVEEKK